jgi:hypothetical protein
MLLAALAIAAALLIFFILRPSSQDGGEEGTIKSPSAAADSKAQAIEGLRMEGTDSKGQRWFLEADTACADAAGAVGCLQGVRLKLETDSGRFEAKAGKCDVFNSKNATLTGGVELLWGKWHAHLDSVNYLREEGRIFSDADVVADGEGVSVRGKGIEVDVGKGTARLTGKVHAVIGGQQ